MPRNASTGCLNSLRPNNHTMLTPLTEHLIALALDEDAGLGDVTSRAIFSDKDTSKAYIQAKEPLLN